MIRIIITDDHPIVRAGMKQIISEASEKPFYDNLLIEESITPANPFRADLATIDRIKSCSQFWASGQWY